MIENHIQIFKALSDSTRLRILLLLNRNGELCVCDIMESLEIAQSTASRHLSILRNAGFVEGERRGVWMYYQNVKSDGLQTELLTVLQKNSESLKETQQDTKRYIDYLKVKDSEACKEQANE
ncbi:MAG: ArsR/SmtB family transcription factor [Desulfobulbia bacterium]